MGKCYYLHFFFFNGIQNDTKECERVCKGVELCLVRVPIRCIGNVWCQDSETIFASGKND